jgi:glycosyltransferase involved in cell wall biosynthesis
LDGPVEVHWVDAARDGRLWNSAVRTRFEDVLDGLRPEVVHVQHLLGLSADIIESARARSIPAVVTLHDLWFQCPMVHLGPRDRHPTGTMWGTACLWHAMVRRPRRLASLARHGGLPSAFADALRRPAALRHQLELAGAVVAPSQFVIDEFIRFGTSPQKLRLLPHATELPRRVAPQAVGRPVRFGFVGAVAPHKGVDVLCRAFRGLEGGATLSIHGPGPNPGYLRRAVRSLGPNMRYEGPFDASEAASVYDSFDVLVVPSIVGESFSLTALEAQVRGLPVIASRIGALPERITSGRDGILVPPGDAHALGDAMRALQDPEEVRRLAAAITPPPPMSSYLVQLETIYQDVVSSRVRDVEVVASV